MPTPVATARQCLTKEAEQALDEAVAVARRRGHAQTTSLHLVSSLLSLPSSALKEACSRTRNSAYSTRIQFKNLDLCLGVSLDRLPSSPRRVEEEPPISNSLMAAIKRSQANQRRQPENFHFYQQQHQQQLHQQQFLSSTPSSSSSPISVLKVELPNLILSILDDPVVSRVFGESGFRSCEIKIAILRPVHQLFRYSGFKGPPVFLCNLNADYDLARRGFSFPFTGFSRILDGEENCRRIGEIMARNDSRRNPLLVGVCGYDALRNFLEMVQRRTERTVLPGDLSGLGVVCIENEVSRFLSGNCKEGSLKLRFEEIDKMVENCVGLGVVISYGDLKAMVADDAASIDASRFVVGELARLLEIHGGKVWLIGAAARYETYLKFLNTFPSVEKDLDLQLLPITTMRFSTGESYPRSSLMESFVPFGGFFSPPSEVKSSLRCRQLCDEKCNEEVNLISNAGCAASVANLHQSNPSSWLQTTDFSTNSLEIMKAKDGRVLLGTKIGELHKRWDNTCRDLHQSHTSPKANSGHLGSQITSVVGFQVLEDGKANVNNDFRSPASTSSTPSDNKDMNSLMSRDLRRFPTAKSSSSTSLVSKGKIFEGPPTKEIEDQCLCSPFSSTSSTVRDGLTSPTSVTSRTLDLNVGITSSCPNGEPEKPSNNSACIGLVQEFSACFAANPSKPSPRSHHPDIHGQFDGKDFDKLYKALAERLGRQEEAVKLVSHTIARCRTANDRQHGANRGDVWLNFMGPDRLAKKELAIALAETLHGSREHLMHVDLGFPDEIKHLNSRIDCSAVSRGKNLVDCIAEKLCKRPFSVLLLENVDRADLLVQNSLSKAVKTGRFSDSHGREFGIGNAIFLTTTSKFTDHGENVRHSGALDYSEEDVLTAKGLPIQMLIGFDLGDYGTSQCSSCNRIVMNKRKLVGQRENSGQCGSLEVAKRAHKASNGKYLDLNFPAAEGIEEVCDVSSEITISSGTWLDDFLGRVDATVTFKPLDFDAISQKILGYMSDCFQGIVLAECSLEIDSRVMMQMVAAACLTGEKAVENWVKCVLRNAFEEAQEKYSLTGRSTVKLVVREGSFADQQLSSGSGELLPPIIVLY